MRRHVIALGVVALLALGEAGCASSTSLSNTSSSHDATTSGLTSHDPSGSAGAVDSTSGGASTSPSSARKATSAAMRHAIQTVPLSGAVFSGIGTLTPAGSVPADQVLHVGVSLQGRDSAGAAAEIRSMYDPSSPRYGQYLTADEWDSRFGPDPAVRSSVVTWLQSGGLDVLQSNGSYVYASGAASQVQSLFGVQLRNFNVAGRAFYANINAPRVPAGVDAVLGLNDYKQAHTLHQVAGKGAGSQPKVFPVSAETSPQDLWSIYDMPDQNKGDGEGLAVFGWYMNGKTIESDLRQFEVENKLPAVPFSVRHFGKQPGSTGTPADGNTDADIEWALDTQASSGMAPNAAGITAYDGYSPTDVDLLAPIAGWIEDHTGSKQGSASYGECEEDPVFSAAGVSGSAASGTEKAWNAVLMKGAALGRSLFVSAGDSGFGCNPLGLTVNGVTLGPVPYQSWPAVSPWVVAVGGTVLTTNDATPPKRDVEYAWTHGGGGPSPFNSQPDYQTSAGVPLPTRGVPDVAAQSGDLLSGYKIVSGGSDTTVGGTSLSAPLMQGMWARVSAASEKGAGFADPQLYRHPDVFFDVVLGTNGANVAKPGWDYTTGLGVPDVAALVKAVDGTIAPVRPARNTAPLTAYAQPSCKKGTTPVVDPAGDATGLVLTSTPRPSVDDLDILSATAAMKNMALVVTMKVTKLSDTPPTGATGDGFDVGFHYGNQAFWVAASRDLGTPSADFGGDGTDRRGTSFGETLPAPAFDLAANTVTVTVPLSIVNKHVTQGVDAIGTRSVLTGFSATTWQTEGVTSGGVDDAAGSCSITL